MQYTSNTEPSTT